MVGVTIKSDALVTVSFPIVTEIGPVVASLGTTAVMVVDVLLVTVEARPLNLTVLLSGTKLKFVPVIVTLVPGNPPVGVKPIRLGMGWVNLARKATPTEVRF